MLALTALVLLFGSARASAVSETFDPNEIFQGILRSRGDENVQEWIDGELAEKAGSISEWYVFALAQTGDYDFSSYQESLLSFLSTHQIYSATSRQKYALALAATGSTDPYIGEVMKNATGRQGLMSWVFGLHFYNNGYSCPDFTENEMIEAILAAELETGGFAVIGQYGDPDVTAMTLQALAPFYEKNDSVKKAADRAFAFLSAAQLPDGDYSGMSKLNLESTAQVLLALSEYGIDPLKDERFIKNGNSLYDGILKYRLNDGTFGHFDDGKFNESATMQAFYTAAALVRRQNGKGRLYDLDHARPDELRTETDQTLPIIEKKPTESKSASLSLPVSRIILIAGILVFAVLLSLWILLSKKKRKKDLILVWIAAAALVGVSFFFRVQTKDGFLSEENTGEKRGIVMISIRCDKAIENYEDLDESLRSEEFVPQSGEILPVTLLPLYENDTVYTVLARACRENEIPFEVQGADENRFSTAYVQGIHYLYETSCGPLSGWMYRVNGIFPIVGCSDYYPLDGDVIEWVYTCSLGHDIGNIRREGEK